MRAPEESTPDPGEAGAAAVRGRTHDRASAIARGCLWAFVVGIGLQLGGGLYEHAAIVSRWATAPGSLVTDMLTSSGQIHAAHGFWPFVSPLVVVLALANGYAAMRAKGRARGWWFGAALLELFVSAMTYLYFGPELAALASNTIPLADIEGRALAWASLNGARIVLEAFAWLLALAAFSRYGSTRIYEPEPPSHA